MIQADFDRIPIKKGKTISWLNDECVNTYIE